jgi:predicted AAA+ superfamily ATPase
MDRSNLHVFIRFAQTIIEAALANSPAVLLVGPRGIGKSELVFQFISKERRYVTLDNEGALDSARYDPTGFVRGLDSVIIDEMQRAPDLLLAIKQSVEDDPRPGRFLLTSSADIAQIQSLPESLAERMEIISLLPISRAEVEGTRPSFLNAAFTCELVAPPFPLIGNELIQSVVAGGYPELMQRRESRRKIWAQDYVKNLLQRDVLEIAAIEKVDQLARLIELLAVHSGRLTNFSQIGGELDIDAKTTQKYTAVLEQLFLVHRLSAWFQSSLSRLVKAPKLYFLDSGLQAAILGLNAEKVSRNRQAFGALLRTFVLSEIMKQANWSDEIYTINHYRDKDQDEVEFLVEDENGALVGIDVKPAATVYATDFKGLRKVESNCGKDLKLGVVLYDGSKTVAFGDRLFAIPISCLWGGTLRS